MTPEHADLIGRIRAAAKAIAIAVNEIADEQRETPPRVGEWSARDVLAHTRDAVLFAYGLRIRRVLLEDDPVFANYDETEFRARLPRVPSETALQMMSMIVAEHEQIAHLLNNLPDDLWLRQGRHPEYGVTTLEYWARRTAEHAEEHAQQIADFKFQTARPAPDGVSD